MDPYAALVQLITHSDSVTWNRFYNFLVANSVLVLAWTAIFATNSSPAMSSMVLITISIFGLLTSPFWAILGWRGKKFQNAFEALAEKVENDAKLWPKQSVKYKPLTESQNIRKSLGWGLGGTFYFLTFFPLAFGIIYIVLLIASLSRLCNGA
ncbi:MAG: hypothetical protein JXA06_06165 [Bacteroidetes bacterium]|nr:hypothetical protein [Bacteroidota bacterium]